METRLKLVCRGGKLDMGDEAATVPDVAAASLAATVAIDLKGVVTEGGTQLGSRGLRQDLAYRHTNAHVGAGGLNGIHGSLRERAKGNGIRYYQGDQANQELAGERGPFPGHGSHRGQFTTIPSAPAGIAGRMTPGL